MSTSINVPSDNIRNELVRATGRLIRKRAKRRRQARIAGLIILTISIPATTAVALTHYRRVIKTNNAVAYRIDCKNKTEQDCTTFWPDGRIMDHTHAKNGVAPNGEKYVAIQSYTDGKHQYRLYLPAGKSDFHYASNIPIYMTIDGVSVDYMSQAPITAVRKKAGTAPNGAHYTSITISTATGEHRPSKGTKVRIYRNGREAVYGVYGKERVDFMKPYKGTMNF